MKQLPILAVALLACTAVHAQSPAEKLEFEVATVRKSPPPGANNAVTAGMKLDAAQVRIGSLPLRDCIAMAYRLQTYQVIGPDWMATVRYDISAKLPAGATADQLLPMLQSLLADRFGLTFHRESKEMAVYALTIGKPPLKLEAHPIDPDAPPASGVDVAGTGSAAGIAISLGNGSSYTFAGGKFAGTKISGPLIARVLERYTDRPVIDATGLTGAYDFSFEVTPEEYQTLLVRAGVNSGVILPPRALRLLDSGGDPLRDAVAQIGLALDARKAPIDVLIVEHVLETPTNN